MIRNNRIVVVGGGATARIGVSCYTNGCNNGIVTGHDLIQWYLRRWSQWIRLGFTVTRK